MSSQFHMKTLSSWNGFQTLWRTCSLVETSPRRKWRNLVTNINDSTYNQFQTSSSISVPCSGEKPYGRVCLLM
ncbi:hypothetical protein K1719_033660 [Acacia pycnantha]|nr:hypothetical protein K1719_033660 [Acacia pycnantha]